jgi:hypothetical protein
MDHGVQLSAAMSAESIAHAIHSNPRLQLAAVLLARNVSEATPVTSVFAAIPPPSTFHEDERDPP